MLIPKIFSDYRDARVEIPESRSGGRGIVWDLAIPLIKNSKKNNFRVFKDANSKNIFR